MTISDKAHTHTARWVVPVVNPRRASLRYRCLYPLNELARRGCDVGIWRDEEEVNDSLTLVFDAWTLFTTTSSIATTNAIVELAAAAKAKGARIILDNCDNQFADSTASPEWRQGLDRLRRLGEMADVIVTCSLALAAEMQRNMDSRARYVVIDDPIEERVVYPDDTFFNTLLSPRRKLAWMRALGLRLALARDQFTGHTPLVWFGSHGNQFAPGGMSDLLPLRPLLERVSESHPISLTIISNQRQKFEANFQDWRFPTHYLEWDRVTFLSALKMHEISIIPSVDNAFTRCKSSNRLTMSIHHGLSVVADPIPSYQAYADAARIGDWDTNLRALLSDVAARKTELARNQNIIQTRNSLAHISDSWANVLLLPLYDDRKP